MKDQSHWLRAGFLVAVAAVSLCVFSPTAAPQNATSPQAVSTPPLASLNPTQNEYTLLFTGDIMLSRAVGAHMAALKDWLLPFRLISDTLHSADFRYCNLECPVSDRGRNLHHLYSFRADPKVMEGLKDAGFNVASQANNHAYDWGPEALLDTLERLRAAGIMPAGAGQNILAAHYPLLVRVGALRIAFLAYVNIDPKEATAAVDRPGVAWLDPAQALTDIRFARPLADLVIVCPHWGVEYALKPTREQVDLAHQMIDAGADLIVGSHPHVVQPVEKYHDRWIAYSLGNFIFDQQGPNTHRGLLLKATVRDKHVIDVQSIPIDINSQFQAKLAPSPDHAAKPAVPERKAPQTQTP